MSHPLTSDRDKLLFTPGPLTTSRAVKEAMLRDLGSRDATFIEVVRSIRQSLLGVAGVSQADGYEAILLQGSGTYSVEAVITATVPRDGKWLVLINGAYGRRIAQICDVAQIPVQRIVCAEDTTPDPTQLERALVADPQISHVAVVHCETTTGILNPVEALGQVVQRHGRRFFVDAMSSFGAVPLDFRAGQIDYLVSSANKCIEGVPGFGFIIARRAALLETEGYARNLSFDLLNQWRGLEENGQFRFTPPTQVLLAFHQALSELDLEGGVAGRGARYRRNFDTVYDGMLALGFNPVLPRSAQGPIISTYDYPRHANFDFSKFYTKLSERGLVIYPGKLSERDCFRIGNIGRLFEADMQLLLLTIREVLDEMGVTMG